MRHDDQQLGRPEIPYKDTKANIEAIASPIEGMKAYATDTHQEGYYNGTEWVWDVSSVFYEPLTNGDTSDPQLVFDSNGDVIMVPT